MKNYFIIFILVCFTTRLQAQGKLDNAKQDLSSPSASPSTSSSNDHHSSNSSNSNSLDSFLLDLFGIMTYGLMIGETQPRSFYDYPYAEGANGEYNRNTQYIGSHSSKLLISNTMVIESETFGNDFKLNYRFLPFLGVEANYLHLKDLNADDSSLGLAGIILNYYRVREEKVSAFWGLGATHLGDGVDKTGFSYNLGLDLYIANPVSFGLYWKQTFVNEQTVNEFRALARYHFNRFSLHGGFIHYQIAGTNFPSAAFGFDIRI